MVKSRKKFWVYIQYFYCVNTWLKMSVEKKKIENNDGQIWAFEPSYHSICINSSRNRSGYVESEIEESLELLEEESPAVIENGLDFGTGSKVMRGVPRISVCLSSKFKITHDIFFEIIN